MKVVLNFAFTFLLLTGFIGSAYSQKIEFRGESVTKTLKGGYKFNNIRVPYEDCTSFFLSDSETPIPYEDVFSSTTKFQVRNIFGTQITFTADIVKKDIYYTPNYGYNIYPEAKVGPNIDMNFFRGKGSILKEIVFIPPQTETFELYRGTGSHVGDIMDPVTKYKEVEQPDGSIETVAYQGYEPAYPYQTLTLMGFFYLLAGDKNLEELCTLQGVPYVKTADDNILIPVGGRSSASARWILKSFYGINYQASAIDSYIRKGGCCLY